MRALAILWVMLFHLRYIGLPSIFYWPARYGWMGVDLFFVLSGYLIGSQLLRPYLKGAKPSLRQFYLRRAFRILPAFLAVLVLYVWLPVFREAPGLSPTWQFLTFTENFRIDYLHDQAFSHFWSLCVEEHFYLILPVLVLALMRRPRFGKTTALIIGICVLGLSLRALIYLHQLKSLELSGDEDAFLLSYVEKLYYPTYTRLDGLLVGVTMAVIKTFRPNWWQEMMGHGRTVLALGIALSGFAMWLFQDRFSFAGTVAGFPVLSLGLGFLVAASVSPTCRLSRVRGFGSVAARAYSLYLTHKEIAHLDRFYFGAYMRTGGWEPFFIAFGTSFAAAALLYFIVERPFLRLRERFQSGKQALAHKSAAAS